MPLDSFWNPATLGQPISTNPHQMGSQVPDFWQKSQAAPTPLEGFLKAYAPPPPPQTPQAQPTAPATPQAPQQGGMGGDMSGVLLGLLLGSQVGQQANRRFPGFFEQNQPQMQVLGGQPTMTPWLKSQGIGTMQPQGEFLQYLMQMLGLG
jgi:hypothetical protein